MLSVSRGGPKSNMMENLSDAEALELLLAAEVAGMDFSGFTISELGTLSRQMAFVSLQLDEKVLEAGERASFAAIVLCGTLELVHGIEPDVRKRSSVSTGQFLGHRAFFEGGMRDADCYCRSEGTVIAVLKYTTIHQLALAEVGIRLLRLLGATSTAQVAQSIHQETAEEKLRFVPCLTDELAPLVLDVATKSPLLSMLETGQLSMLAQLMMVTEAAEGETILRAGRKSVHMCIVLAGEVESRIGHAVLVHRLGDCLDAAAMLQSAVHATEYVARSAVRLAVLTRDDLDRLPMHHAGLYRAVLFAIARVSLAETAAIEALRGLSAAEALAAEEPALISVPIQAETEMTALASVPAELIMRSRLDWMHHSTAAVDAGQCGPASGDGPLNPASGEQRRGSRLGAAVGTAAVEKLLAEAAKRVVLEEDCARLRAEVEQAHCPPALGHPNFGASPCRAFCRLS